MTCHRFSTSWGAPVFGALCLGCFAAAQALGQEAMKSAAADGAILCAEHNAATDVLAIFRDPDREIVVRRMSSLFAAGVCRELQLGDAYDVLEVEPSGIVKIRLHGRVTAYLAPLSPPSR